MDPSARKPPFLEGVAPFIGFMGLLHQQSLEKWSRHGKAGI